MLTAHLAKTKEEADRKISALEEENSRITQGMDDLRRQLQVCLDEVSPPPPPPLPPATCHATHASHSCANDLMRSAYRLAFITSRASPNGCSRQLDFRHGQIEQLKLENTRKWRVEERNDWCVRV